MKLDVVFRDVKSTDELGKRLETKLSKIEKILHRQPSVRVTLEKRKADYQCTIRFHDRGHDYVAQAQAADLFTASDEAAHKLEIQVNKHSEKKAEKRGSKIAAVANA